MVGLDREQRQQVLDAAAVLQDIRRRATAGLTRGADLGPSIRIVGADCGPFEWLRENSRTWRHVLSTRDVTTTAGLSRSMPNNRRILDSGLRMTSVFDHAQTEPGARALLEGEPPGTYFYGFAPLWVRIVNREAVYMHGPCADRDSILLMTSTTALSAALAYWDAVRPTVWPCASASAGPQLTARQQQVLRLLRHDLSDERIAHALGVSVRTVRHDIAETMRLLEVRSRFSVGFAYAALTGDEHDATALG